MITRTKLSISLGIIAILVGIVVFTLLRRDSQPGQVFSATINRDCAPWDGAAFTVTIPLQNMGISISIYQAPDLKLPGSFLFPDETQRIGHAFLILPLGSPEPLKGKVSFQRVAQDVPTAGRFDLRTHEDQRFSGSFTAEWGNDFVLCG